MKTVARRVVLAGAALLLVIQVLPFGRDHTNPPVRKDPPWDVPDTRELAVRACFDCHSNETVWPWYAHVAPISWLVQRDVHEGTQEAQLLRVGPAPEEGPGIGPRGPEGIDAPVVLPVGRLTATERQALIRGLDATLGRGAR